MADLEWVGDDPEDDDDIGCPVCDGVSRFGCEYCQQESEEE